MLKKATVNIGERQKRRRREISVMDCAEDREAIIAAVHEVLSEDFQRRLQTLEIPHTDGKIAVRMKDILRDISLEGLFQKHFVDIMQGGIG